MDTSYTPPSRPEDVPGSLTPEKVRRARERVADLSQLPDPVEELIKARDAGYREP